jgi:hypothetical protein
MITTTTPTTTAAFETEIWSWAAGAYGCGTSSPSGNLLLCYATGTGPVGKRDGPQATAAPVLEARDVEEYVKRANSSQSSSPDLGWLDTIVGAVPYHKGDLVASIIWVVVTFLLIPLFLIRIIRRSSLVIHSLICVTLWIIASITAFGIRAWMSLKGPTTELMIVENVLLQIIPCLLLEPVFNLLAMYSTQGGEVKSGVPRVCILLRIVNVAAMALFAATAAYTAIFLNQWNDALMSSTISDTRDAFPAYSPANIAQIGPIIASFMMLAVIAGGLLLIPVSRGSMRPGGFLAALFTLVAISVAYRVLQSLHAHDVLSNETEAESFSTINTVTSTKLLQLATENIVKIADIAPPGMYSSTVKGIDWSALQSKMSSRMIPQSAVTFNLIYMLPMWLQVFMLFFVHAPRGGQSAKVTALEASA